jgi:hypothetical protein
MVFFVIDFYKIKAHFFRYNMYMLTMLLHDKKERGKRIPEKLLRIEELMIYLTKRNDSIMVYVKKIYINPENGSKIYEMSNGISYTKNADGEWFVV